MTNENKQIPVKQRPIIFSTDMVQAILAGRKTMTRRILKHQPEPPRAIYNEGDAIPILKENGNDLLLRFNWITERFYPKIYKDFSYRRYKCPYGKVGDILCVKENFYEYGSWQRRHNPGKGRIEWYFSGKGQYAYLRDPLEFIVEKKRVYDKLGWYKRSSLFMPKEACRIFLQITDIRVERLQDISEEDAIMEGIFTYPFEDLTLCRDYMGSYKDFIKGNPYGFNHGSEKQLGAVASFCTLWELINGRESWIANPWVWVVSFERAEKPQ